MDEFALIEAYFNQSIFHRPDVLLGIGDDAACVSLSAEHDLVISTDTLVENIHFLANWGAYAIAWRAVMVNLSDIAAMGGEPRWASLAITLPDTLQLSWCEAFTKGLHDALNAYQVTLIGGDTTRGPCVVITLTLHGVVPKGHPITRRGAKPQDTLWLSDPIGLAGAALHHIQTKDYNPDWIEAICYPKPRTDLRMLLQQYASAAIDISDGLSADLAHLCTASKVGARLMLDAIPIHPAVTSHVTASAIDFVLGSGDDYALCFTIPPEKSEKFKQACDQLGIVAYPIGIIESELGLRAQHRDNTLSALSIRGYRHF